MLKRFLKDSFIYGFSGILTRGISLLLVPFYTRVLIPADYGVIDLIAIVAAIVKSVFSLEITQAIARFYPDCQNENEEKRYASTALFFTLMGFVLFLVLSVVFREALTCFLMENTQSTAVFLAACFSIVLNGMYAFFQNQLRWRLKPRHHAFSSIIYAIVTVGLNVIFILGFKTGVIGIFWGQLIGGLVASVVAFYLARQSFGWEFDLRALNEMLRYAAPLVPSAMGVFLLIYMDRIAIKSLLTLTEVGLYGIGYRIASVVEVIMVGITSAVSPLIFARYQQSETPAEIARIFRLFVFAALILGAILSIFAREALIILTSPAFYGGAAVVPFLVFAQFLSTMYVFTPGLQIVKKTRHIAVINLSGALLNWLLNWILIPKMGISGAALATLISYSTIFLCYLIGSQRYYYVPHLFGRLLLGLSITLGVISIGFTLVLDSLMLTILLKMLLIFLLLVSLIGIGLIQEFKVQSLKLKFQSLMSKV